MCPAPAAEMLPASSRLACAILANLGVAHSVDTRDDCDNGVCAKHYCKDGTMDLLRDMVLFVEVARAGSFTKAAQRLGVPTSTLSRRIQALEKGLNLKLMLRTTRSVELTEAGTVYLKRCADIVDA